MPEISVVMPVFNGEDYLSEAIESILNQSFVDFEFIAVIEKGSSAESVRILEQYAQNDKRIKLILNEERLGISESLNVGLRASTGKYIARMDADDICNSKRFEIEKLYLDAYPEVGLVGTFHKVTDSPNWWLDYVCDPELIRSELLFFIPMRHPTIMFRRVLTENCFYNKNLSGVEDYEFFYRLSKITKMSNISMPELFTYRRSEIAASNVYSERDLILRKQIQKHIIYEQLDLDFNDSNMNLLLVLGLLAYKESKLENYPSIIRRLEMLLYQIEMQNRKLGVYPRDILLQTLQHRWFREIYKLRMFLKGKDFNSVGKVLMESRYYSLWF